MSTLAKDEMVLNEEIDTSALQLIRDNFDELYEAGALGHFKDAKKGYQIISDKKVVQN